MEDTYKFGNNSADLISRGSDRYGTKDNGMCDCPTCQGRGGTGFMKCANCKGIGKIINSKKNFDMLAEVIKRSDSQEANLAIKEAHVKGEITFDEWQDLLDMIKD